MRPRHLPATLLATVVVTVLAVTAALPAAAQNDGFLYGRITTSDGTSYEGRLRWDDEEAFWGDFFNSSKEENRWVDEAPRRSRESRRRSIEVFGVRLGSYSDWHDESRQFVARFGDIARIEPQGHEELRVTLKSGTTFDLEGGSNDVGAKVVVWDASLGVVKVEWRRIRSIELMPTPASVSMAPTRLHGKVTTREGTFTGHLQWDQHECLGSDELDGETADGDLAVEMSTIRSIERRSRSSSTVVLRDGRELVLSGTNDVDSSNRGIYVDDPRYGRVLVSWDAFERVDFTLAGSGPAYGDFPPGQRIAGTVTTLDGRKLTGYIVYDLDESETTEMLDGHRNDIEYSIPFALVAAIVPRSESARVTLRGGEDLVLEDTTDVSADNAGMLVFEPGRDRPHFVSWDDIERIDFAAPEKR
jgi:hypothetical protein